MKMVNVKEIVGKEQTPEKDGRRLGEFLVGTGDEIRSFVLDVKELAPEDLVSSFVNSVLLAFERAGRAGEIEAFRSVTWEARYRTERERLEMAVNAYLDAREQELQNA